MVELPGNSEDIQQEPSGSLSIFFIIIFSYFFNQTLLTDFRNCYHKESTTIQPTLSVPIYRGVKREVSINNLFMK